jgi:hypothetical protein
MTVVIVKIPAIMIPVTTTIAVTTTPEAKNAGEAIVGATVAQTHANIVCTTKPAMIPIMDVAREFRMQI